MTYIFGSVLVRQAARDYFERFIYLWIAFNGWAACVTEEDRDGRMIRCVANCPELRQRFLQQLDDRSQFRSEVTRFSSLWPIFKAQDLRRGGVRAYGLKSRIEIIEHYLRADGIDHQPECWEYHKERGEDAPLDWPHSIHTIYRVRCNLFHGEKTPHSEMDSAIVKAAYDVLASFVVQGGIIVPTGQ